MDGKKMKYAGALQVVFVLCLAWLVACGSSRQGSGYDEDTIDMDELLGEEQGSGTEQNSDEAEVLRLLGIKPTEEQSGVTEATATTQEPASSQLEEDLQRLREDVLRKDQEIAQLRAEISKQERRIGELEAMSSRTRRISMRTNNVAEPSPEFRAKYQQALRLFKGKNYARAIDSFNELILSDPNNSLSDNCQYWIGECYYAQGKYNQAIAEFEKVFSYPNSNKNDDAQLMLGLCYVKLGDREQARSAFSQLLSIYPNSEYRSIAQRYVAQL